MDIYRCHQEMLLPYQVPSPTFRESAVTPSRTVATSIHGLIDHDNNQIDALVYLLNSFRRSGSSSNCSGIVKKPTYLLIVPSSPKDTSICNYRYEGLYIIIICRQQYSYPKYTSHRKWHVFPLKVQLHPYLRISYELQQQ